MPILHSHQTVSVGVSVRYHKVSSLRSIVTIISGNGVVRKHHHDSPHSSSPEETGWSVVPVTDWLELVPGSPSLISTFPKWVRQLAAKSARTDDQYSWEQWSQISIWVILIHFVLAWGLFIIWEKISFCCVIDLHEQHHTCGGGYTWQAWCAVI